MRNLIQQPKYVGDLPMFYKLIKSNSYTIVSWKDGENPIIIGTRILRSIIYE